MRTLTVLLFFAICSPDADREDAPLQACELGQVAASSCAAAEAYIRQGLREGQVLHLMGCRE